MTDNITGRITHRDEMHRRMTWKTWVRVASTANVNLASPGASIDGVSLAVGDRFLAKSQTAGAENGLYTWNGAAVAATRAYDMDTAEEVVGTVVHVIAGTVNGGKIFRNTNTTTPTLGTTALTFTEFTSGSTVVALDDLSDVVITSPAAGQRLRYDGASWVNSSLTWTPLTVFDPTTANYLPLVDGSGNAVMSEV
jgi:hypothetical protein